MNLVIGIFLLFVSAGAARAEGLTIVRGGTVENGGNTAWCRFPQEDGPGIAPPGSGLPADGAYYMLDYAHAIRTGSRPEDFAPVRSWDESSLRILGILSKASPALLATFEDFVRSTQAALAPPGVAGRPGRRSWVATRQFQIVEYRPDYAPCMAVLQEAIDPDIHGAIISFRGYLRTITRRQRGDEVEYTYNGALLRYLAERSSLQLSMLLVHEWLWDHTSRLGANQGANVFLHGHEVERMTGAQIRRHLRALGLRF